MRTILAFFLLLLFTVSCSGDGGASVEDLAQTYDASEMVYTDSADPSRTADVIAAGATFRITLNENGTYDSVFTPPGDPAETLTGTWEASTDVMTIIEDGQSGDTQFDYEFSVDTLILTGGSAEYDFDGDSVPEDAKLDITLHALAAT
jgi:hypothetical protein